MTIYEERAAKHEQRAQMHERAGRSDYAAGSRRKAAKNRARQRARDIIISGHKPPTQMEDLVNRRIQQKVGEVRRSVSETIYGRS